MNKWVIPTEPKPFFKLTEYIEAGLVIKGGITIINGGRNLGKTTGSFIDYLSIANDNNKVLYIRQSVKELDTYRANFNAKYHTKYRMTPHVIWKLEPEIYVNKKTGEEKTIYKEVECIGYVTALSGTDGTRSVDVSGIGLVFIDEYNQIGNHIDTQAFITVLTTFLRTNKDAYIVFIGNRDEAASPILIDWRINYLRPENYPEIDYVYPFGKGEYENKCFFIDLWDNRFTNYHNETIWKFLGGKSEKTRQYFNQGYKSMDNLDCINIEDHLREFITWKYIINTKNEKIGVGQLDNLVVVHINPDEGDKTNAVNVSTIDAMGKVKNSKLIDDDPHSLYEILQRAIINDNIIYTSINVKNMIMNLYKLLARRVLRAKNIYDI